MMHATEVNYAPETECVQERVMSRDKQWQPDDLLTTPEVAEILDVTPAWVSELCRQGRVPDAIRRGRFWFIPYKSIENIKDVKMGRPPKN